MRKTISSTSCALVLAMLVAGACTEPVGPQRTHFVPSFSYSPNGSSLNRSVGSLGESGSLLIKGFNPTNPHHGDAIVATFFWLGSTNVIDSVVDVLTTNPYSHVGNKYTLVEYVTAGGYSMATYVATNVQNFPDPNTDPGQSDILAVAAYLSAPVSDGGVTLSSWTGIEDDFAVAVGGHRSAAGSGTSPTPASAGPIAVNAGALAYTVTMSGLWGLDRPTGYTSTGQGSSDNSIKQDAAFAVQGSAGTVDPQWSWFFGSSGTWLVSTLALNTAKPPVGDLTVTSNTTGLSLDLDGYTVTVDGSQSKALVAHGSVTFTGLSAGSHSVAVSGVAVNCTVSGSNPRDIAVPSAATATTSFAVSCVPGPATRLVFSVQPSNTGPLATITPAVKVKAIDAQGSTVTTYTGQVTIAIGRNGGLLLPGTLSGNKTVAPVNGVATFSNLSIDQKGNGYTLLTTSPGLTSAQSVSFNIAIVCLGPLCL